MRSLPIIVLTIMIFGVTLVYAAPCGETKFNSDGSIIVCPDNPDMAADYKLNYAIMNSEEFAKSKILIFDYDIEFAQRAAMTAQESCTKYGGTHCDNVKDYQAALVTMTNMKSQQTVSPPADGGKAKKGALGQLSKMGEKIKDLLKALLEGLLDVIRDTWAKLW